MARRLGKEFSDINAQNLDWAKVQLVDDNLFKWRAMLKGPDGSPYEGGIFNLEMEYPNEYPFKPPKVKFLTKTYHPNIKSSGDNQIGNICLPILTESWSPQLRAMDVLNAIKEIMITPEVGHPVEADIAQQFVNDKDKFIKTAKDWTRKHAK